MRVKIKGRFSTSETDQLLAVLYYKVYILQESDALLERTVIEHLKKRTLEEVELIKALAENIRVQQTA